MNGGGSQREGDTESETGSRLWAVSTEPDAGLKPTDREIMTWAEVRRLTDWATQVPQYWVLLTGADAGLLHTVLSFPHTESLWQLRIKWVHLTALTVCCSDRHRFDQEGTSLSCFQCPFEMTLSLTPSLISGTTWCLRLILCLLCHRTRSASGHFPEKL